MACAWRVHGVCRAPYMRMQVLIASALNSVEGVSDVSKVKAIALTLTRTRTRTPTPNPKPNPKPNPAPQPQPQPQPLPLTP